MPILLKPTEVTGVFKVEPRVFPDTRGCFLELYTQTALTELNFTVKQINMSVSFKHVLRGLHFQTAPQQQAKLVFCLTGSILDIAVDMETGQYVQAYLSEENRTGLFIPQGMAHGFLTLQANTTVVYACDNEYHPELDSGIRYDSFGIDWPIDTPIISQKDLLLPKL